MFWLGPFEYKSKKELLDWLKAYLQKAPTGVITNKLAVKKMHLLIAMHPEASRKNWCRDRLLQDREKCLGSG